MKEKNKEQHFSVVLSVLLVVLTGAVVCCCSYFYNDTNLTCEGSTSQRSLKGPISIPITVDIRFQPMNFGRTQTFRP